MSRADPVTVAADTGRAILAGKSEFAAALVELEFDRHPELEQRYGPIGHEKSLQDAGYHLAYLANALVFDSPMLFVDYIAWARLMLAQRGVLPADLAFHLECTRDVLAERLQEDQASCAGRFVTRALEAMPDMPDDLPSYVRHDDPLAPLAHHYLQTLLRGERRLASEMVLGTVEEGSSVRDVYLQIFQPALYEIGRLWQINEISVAQEHYCTAATQLIMSQLYPLLFAGERRGPTLVMTSVAGDLHEIGARMVADFFEMDGWNTFYTGANTPHESVIRTLAERDANVLGISATITSNVGAVAALIAAVRDHPACREMKILVGGNPFNLAGDLWQRVDADGSGRDAQQAITVAGELLAGRDART